MIWLLALQLALPPQQQHYNNANNYLSKMEFGQADTEVDLALRLDPTMFRADSQSEACLCLLTGRISQKTVSSKQSSWTLLRGCAVLFGDVLLPAERFLA